MNKQSVAYYYDLLVKNKGRIPKCEMLKSIVTFSGNPEADYNIAKNKYKGEIK